MSQREKLIRPVFSAMLLAAALLLPFLTGQIQEIGKMLCPMHIPVLICGFICGKYYGAAIGLIAPILRSAIFGMPLMSPSAIAMSIELLAYGFFAGLLYEIFPKKIPYIYASLIISMLIGRIVWGGAMLLIAGVSETSFSFSAFLAGAFTSSILGIIVHILIIPLVVIALRKTKIMAK